MAAVALRAVAAGPALADPRFQLRRALDQLADCSREAEFLSTPLDGAPGTTRRVTPDAISPASFSMPVRRVRARREGRRAPRARCARDSGKP